MSAGCRSGFGVQSQRPAREQFIADAIWIEDDRLRVSCCTVDRGCVNGAVSRYAHFNYQAVDIANFFCEFTIDYVSHMCERDTALSTQPIIDEQSIEAEGFAGESKVSSILYM